MILTEITAKLQCDFKGCTNAIPGHLTFSPFGGFGFVADGGKISAPWVMTNSPEGFQTWCPLHTSHAPKIQVAQAMPKQVQ